MVARYAYVERIKDNTQEKSLASGLRLVSVNGGSYNAIEDNLKEYTIGLNYYFTAHNLKLFIDSGYLVRNLTPVGVGMINDQHNNRFRTMIRYLF